MTKRMSIAALALSVLAGTVQAGDIETITFDDVIVGETMYAFGDVVFSTDDPFGFNTVGPGPNQLYIDEPGLEGTSLLPVDLRVDFEVGAIDFIRFGFALNSFDESQPLGDVTFTLFDADDIEIASQTVAGAFFDLGGGMFSSFPEGEVFLPFAGTAAYATFDFESQLGRYIIDNFQGNFGEIPAPGTGALLAAGLLLLQRRRR
ncbi:MAG: MYXO-CTERM sorting domain-containing protein [Phycisphaerales bacterium]